MNQERLLQVLLMPHVSEKSSLLAESKHQHVFKVLPDATKGEIKQAVEELFKVKVSQVRVLNIRAPCYAHDTAGLRHAPRDEHRHEPDLAMKKNDRGCSV